MRDTLATKTFSETRYVLSRDREFPRADAFLPGGTASRHGVKGNLGALAGREHAVLHAYIYGLLSKEYCERISETIIASAVAQVQQSIQTSRPFDLIESVCAQIPLLVSVRSLGLDETLIPAIRELKRLISRIKESRDRSPEAVARIVAADRALGTLVLESISAQDVTAPGGSLLEIIARTGPEVFPDWDVTDTMKVALDFLGGGETPYALGNIFLGLLSDPETKAAFLQTEPEHRLAAVDELLRLYGPVVYVTRRSNAATKIGSTDVHPEQLIHPNLVAANMDPAKYPMPESFNPHRRGLSQQVAFGAGQHYCVGANLAAAEIAMTVTQVFRAYPNLRIAGPVERLSDGNEHVRRVLTLPVTIESG